MKFNNVSENLVMLRIKPGAAGSESKYANHCAMLPPHLNSFCLWTWKFWLAEEVFFRFQTGIIFDGNWVSEQFFIEEPRRKKNGEWFGLELGLWQLRQLWQFWLLWQDLAAANRSFGLGQKTWGRKKFEKWGLTCGWKSSSRSHGTFQESSVGPELPSTKLNFQFVVGLNRI